MIESAKPEEFGFSKKELSDVCWKSVRQEIKKMEEFKTPKAKLIQLGRGIGIIAHIFDLYRGNQMNSDKINNMYIIVHKHTASKNERR